jgi:hypothetical protein
MRKKRVVWFVAALGLILLCVIIAPLVGVAVECRIFAGDPPAAKQPENNASETEGLDNYARLEDQTYLTLPEWYIVYSADEYAAFIANNRPSQFPYFGAIRQFWSSYYDVCAVTRDTYSFNSGYHLTLVVIGTSFTLENIIKGLYENTLGRATEWVGLGYLTEEDVYAGQVAKEYGDFIHTIPWYEFPYPAKLAGLWTETGLFGPNLIRKWERKIALSVEYGVKSLYAWLIGQGTAATYAPEDLEIQVWVTGISADVLRQHKIRIIKPIADQTAIVAVPRYEAFTKTVPKLTGEGMQFIEIAGNDEILITLIAPNDWSYNLPDGEFLFAMPILTQPTFNRLAIKIPVTSLHLVLRELANQGIQLEHIYDY